MTTTRERLAEVQREKDPVKRAELHAARTCLLAAESLLSHARLNAREAGNPLAETKVREAEESLNTAMLALVEALATN